MMVDRSRLPRVGPDPVFTFPAIEKHALPSGLRVWTVEHPGVSLVTLVLLVPAGAAADPADRPGLAALTGDLLDEGAGSLDALGVEDALMRLGTRLDTEVGPDATILSLTPLAQFTDRALTLLADIFLHPRFEVAEFERVRTQRLNRLLQLRDMPPVIADRVFARLAYVRHPYAHLGVGTEDALKAVTLDDVLAFHGRVCDLSRATLVVVGDGRHGDFVRAAARAFGQPSGSTGGPIPDAATWPAPPRAARVALVDRPGAAQSELRVGQVTTSRNSPDHYPLLVLNMVLGGQFASRLNLKLRQEKGFTYGVRTSFDLRRGPGPFVMQAGVQTEVTAEALQDALAEIRAVCQTRPPTDDELNAARAALTRGFPRGFETSAQIARAAAQMALYDLDDDYYSQFMPRIRAVSAGNIARAVRAHLDPDRLLAVVVGDGARVSPALQRAGLAPISESALP